MTEEVTVFSRVPCPLSASQGIYLLLNCFDLQPSSSMQTACDSTFTAVPLS